MTHSGGFQLHWCNRQRDVQRQKHFIVTENPESAVCRAICQIHLFIAHEGCFSGKVRKKNDCRFSDNRLCGFHVGSIHLSLSEILSLLFIYLWQISIWLRIRTSLLSSITIMRSQFCLFSLLGTFSTQRKKPPFSRITGNFIWDIYSSKTQKHKNRLDKTWRQFHERPEITLGPLSLTKALVCKRIPFSSELFSHWNRNHF